MFDYPVTLTPDDNGTFLATVDDIPEVVTYGDDEADAVARAADAIVTALGGYIADRRDIPTARKAKAGERCAALPLMAVLKLQLYVAMRAKDWRKADLARAMALSPVQIDRLLELRHSSRIEQIDAAFAALDRQVVIELA